MIILHNWQKLKSAVLRSPGSIVANILSGFRPAYFKLQCLSCQLQILRLPTLIYVSLGDWGSIQQAFDDIGDRVWLTGKRYF